MAASKRSDAQRRRMSAHAHNHAARMSVLYTVLGAAPSSTTTAIHHPDDSLNAVTGENDADRHHLSVTDRPPPDPVCQLASQRGASITEIAAPEVVSEDASPKSAAPALVAQVVARVSGRAVEDLLPEDVRVAGVLCELAEHLQLQGPHQAVATTVDDVVEGERSHGSPGLFTSLSMGGLDRRDRVALRHDERTVRCGRDADLGVGAARDGLVEPDTFDIRDVLDQPEQGGLRRDESGPCFLLAEIIE